MVVLRVVVVVLKLRVLMVVLVPRFLLCWLWLTHGSCEGLQNEIGHPAGGRFPF